MLQRTLYLSAQESAFSLDDFRANLAKQLGKTLDDRLTDADLKRLRDEFGWSKAQTDYLSRWRGWPFKWLGAASNDEDLPRWFRIAVAIGRIVGKPIDEKFTEADLKTLADHFGWGNAEISIWRPLVGHTLYEIPDTIGAKILDLAGDIFTGSVGGLPNPLDAFDAIGRLWSFLSDPANWLAILALIGGGLVCAYALPRVAESLR